MNMKLKSTLWALAFACAAVSCSDDLGESGNGNNPNEEQGQSAYMKVLVNSEIATRSNPTGGDEGDGDEVSSPEEGEIKDVTVVLYDKSTGTLPTGVPEYAFVGETNKIAGAGFAKNTNTTTGSPYDEHEWMATIKVAISDKAAAWDGKTFGIIAITNLGENNAIYSAITATTPSITNGKQLADYLQTEIITDQGFVMSTHTVKLGTTETKIELDASATEDNAPKAEVFVERLAAKVRINKGAASTEQTGNRHLGNFVYALGNDRVVLQNAAIVNQLTSGSFLLKRVTKTPAGGTAAISNDIEYLGLETPDKGNATNYVIDPWTSKKATSYVTYSTLQSEIATGTPSLNYANHFGQTDYNALWTNSTATTLEYEAVKLNGTTETSPLLLCYTMENTTSDVASLNGYSTGALFQATYYPEKWTAVIAGDATNAVDIDYDGGADGTQKAADEVTADATTLPAGQTFYVYNQKVYKDYEAILAGYLNDALTTQTAQTDLTVSKFNKTNIATLKVADYLKSAASTKVKDVFGYIDYLNTRAAAILATATTDEQKASATFAATDAFEDYKVSDACTDASVRTFTDGKCFYNYWIRHSNNNLNNNMGIMEFAIVRNNIYDLTVQSISKLGLSGSEVPDPKDPDEDGTARMIVNIHVKNWVVRSNSDIIL